jgi:hypothetical protein
MDSAGTPLQWVGHTTLHPLGLAAVLVLGVLMLCVPRRFALSPLVTMACLIAPAQRIVVMGADFNLMRIMILFGLARLMVRREFGAVRFNGLDLAVVAWMGCGTLVYALRRDDADAFVSQAGWVLELGGAYFLGRQLIRTWDDVLSTVAAFCVVAVPVAVAFLVERASGLNPFSFFGGVPERTLIRDGRLRCQGAFAHPIMAGCFWAALLPLMVAMVWQRKSFKWIAVAGIGASLFVIVNTASSTPVMGLVFGVIGAALFVLRRHVRMLWWGLLLALPCLHMAMNNPVWHLLARVDIFSGSTGYHRYVLIDAAINNIDDWWLLGTDTPGAWGEGLDDVTNQYLFEGVKAGVLGMVAFIVVLRVAFKQVGVAWRCAAAKPEMLLSWAIGVSLFVHATAFLAVAYFGQIHLVLMMTIAMAGGAPGFCRERRVAASRIYPDKGVVTPRMAMAG